MTNIASEISQWAATLPFWEQAALDKVISGMPLIEEDYDELLRYLLEDAKSVEVSGTRPVLNSANLTVPECVKDLWTTLDGI